MISTKDGGAKGAGDDEQCKGTICPCHRTEQHQPATLEDDLVLAKREAIISMELAKKDLGGGGF